MRGKTSVPLNAEGGRIYYALSSLVALITIHVVLQVAFFSTEFRPDEGQALGVFSWAIFKVEELLPMQEVALRIILLVVDLSICGVLYSLGLITSRVVLFAAVWPLSVFLFTKIYWEFYVFPLCLVRYDLKRIGELIFVGVLGGLFLLYEEGNLLILILFRLTLLAIKMGYSRLAPLGVAAGGVALNVLFYSPLLASIPILGLHLSRFQWTRETANPEYSIIETVGVFFSSLHFFTLHTEFWWIDALFTLLVLVVIFSYKGFVRRLKQHRHELYAVLAVVLAMTEITHAFQNARYYFFFIPLVAYLAPVRAYPALAFLGVLHVGFKLSEIMV